MVVSVLFDYLGKRKLERVGADPLNRPIIVGHGSKNRLEIKNVNKYIFINVLLIVARYPIPFRFGPGKFDCLAKPMQMQLLVHPNILSLVKVNQ